MLDKATHGRRLVAAAAALAAGAAVILSATPALAAADGYVRLAHLSPDTPAVDVYLKSATGSGEPQVFRGVAYGDMSRYLRLPTGRYQVAMRKAGAEAAEPPVITTEVGVERDAAYTVAGVGRFADLGLRVLDDDLSLPGADKSKVRVIQASVKAPVLNVAGRDGGSLGDAVEFATTTAYREVRPGRWSVEVEPAGGGRSSVLPCTLGAGSVYSLVVLDGPGGLRPRLHVDAERRGVVPLGGVATGAGGSASASPGAASLVTLVALVLVGALVAIRAGRFRAFPVRR